MVLHTLPQSVERTEDLSLLCIMYKMKQLHLCERIGDPATRKGDIYVFQTDIAVVGAYARSPYYYESKLWNSLPSNIQNAKTKAYIPLQSKTPRVGGSRWVIPPISRWGYYPTRDFVLLSKTAKICATSNAKPNASQWNIGCVGSPTQNFRVGHLHFMLFVLISFASGNQREPSLQWNMSLRPNLNMKYSCYGADIELVTILEPYMQFVSICIN